MEARSSAAMARRRFLRFEAARCCCATGGVEGSGLAGAPYNAEVEWTFPAGVRRGFVWGDGDTTHTAGHFQPPIWPPFGSKKFSNPVRCQWKKNGFDLPRGIQPANGALHAASALKVRGESAMTSSRRAFFQTAIALPASWDRFRPLQSRPAEPESYWQMVEAASFRSMRS